MTERIRQAVSSIRCFDRKNECRHIRAVLSSIYYFLLGIALLLRCQPMNSDFLVCQVFRDFIHLPRLRREPRGNCPCRIWANSHWRGSFVCDVRELCRNRRRRRPLPRLRADMAVGRDALDSLTICEPNAGRRLVRHVPGRHYLLVFAHDSCMLRRPTPD